MQLTSSAAPIYLPEADQTSVVRLGLNPLRAENWILNDEDLPLFHQHKLEQARLRPQSVYGELPGSQAAVAELIALLQEHLIRDHSATYCNDGGSLRHRGSNLKWDMPPVDLWQASLLVAEDICILQEIDKEFVMTAASVCSPSNWHPADKLGRSLDVIHGPVPDYDTKLSSRVTSLFHSLKPHKPLLRYNWSLQFGNELYWRDRIKPVDRSLPQYWRVERQTLRRLPASGAVVFCIRIFLYERSVIDADPVQSARLAALLQRLPPQEKAYKGLE